MRKKVCLILLPLLLAACATEPPKPLAEQLAGKTPEEKQEILRLACLNEAEYSTKEHKKKLRPYSVKHRHISDTSETSRLKTLCREMTDEYPVED